ncbi:NupC/NupG family nucleoside CNT transporter [Aeoliella sp. ICT_H6.2]|uniref:Nucleoside permease n=1 Tax=Aeoliella straminimaris TaxID=2954799 RepID=A0A9X2FD41_9BACT|nr:NupC/NupG family nucleoside CNT transporter [Aeoliella straminimaris]MCO6045998.1 NupC/NupG family nucleoside CNT transporter [Aeoliella straminimaris]
MERVISFAGLFVMIGLAWLMSSHKTKVQWRVVFGGLLLQFAFAWFVLKTKSGEWVFARFADVFRALLDCSDAGSSQLFGEGFQEHFLAFKVLPTIIFFSALMSLLYYIGIIQIVVKLFAKLMQYTLGTSGAETLSAAANVFVGQTEAPLVIRPYLPTMTMSELNAVMVGGFATIAGGVLAAYVGMGISAEHLLSASVISAPAALLIAKVMQPEVDTPETLGEVRIEVRETHVNALEAVADGTVSGLKLALNVGAMLIVFFALIAVANALLAWLASMCLQMGLVAGPEPPTWSLELIFGYLFYPIAWVMGVEPKDCLHVGQLLGIKWFGTEFVAYETLGDWMKPDSGVELSDRSITIATYALCGFANFASIGIQLGGIGGLAPERRADLAKLGLRAMIGGSLAAFMTACVAGMLYVSAAS